jgi:ubiquitin carboxyl-terminal hydrolase 34
LGQLIEDTDLQVSDLMSRAYFPSLGWMLQLNGIPYFRTAERIHGTEAINLVTRLNDQLVAPPFNVLQWLSEYAACIMALIPRWPQLSSPLVSIVTIAHNLVDSGNERRKYQADDALINSSTYIHMTKSAYTLIRVVDDYYQTHVSKKSSWITSDVSDPMLRFIAWVYFTLSLRDQDFALQIAKDLSITVPDAIPSEEGASIIFYGWKFAALKKHILDGRMELRVHGMETMQGDLVNVWRQYIQNDPTGIEHPVVQYLVRFLRENEIVEYIVSIDSHPQLISRSGNIVGFLVVTSTYVDTDTDTIWKAVTESPDPRTVSEVLRMLTRTFHMHLPTSPALLYLCSKLLDLPLARFDSRMVDFCEQLLHQVREKHSERHQLLDEPHVDAVLLRLCVRLIRESAAADDLSVEHKALLQKFSSSQLTLFMDVGLSEMDKMETYERCVQDLAEMNQFTVGSIQALNALIPSYDTQEIRKLAMDFDLTRLLISEMAHTVDINQTDFTESFSRNGFLSRIHLLARIIDKVPDTITADLSDILWRKVLMSKSLVQQGRRALWDTLCGLTRHSTKSNPFIERCIHGYLSELSPAEGYFLEVLSFAKQAINYEVRFNPPAIAGENDVISIPGMDRIWDFILTAPPGSIETDATNFAIEVYLDHNIIHRSPRSAVEATHVALVDRCVDQLKSAASKLKFPREQGANGVSEPMATDASEEETRPEELRFSRSLLFLRQFLQGLRSRPQYSPPQNSPPGLPGRPVKGDLVNIRYQAFDGSTQSKVRSLQIGDLSTAAELVERLVQITGFSKVKTIYSGHRVNFLEKPTLTVRDLKLNSGLLIVRRDPDSREAALAGRRQPLTSVDSEVLKHFDDLYDLLALEDHLAREIYDFLVVFPPQKRVLQLVRATDTSEQDMFPIDKPYNFLYSVNALSNCLREEALESSPNEAFVSHSVSVLVAALTRPEMSDSLGNCPTRLLFATSLVECLLYALLVRPPLAGDAFLVPDSTALVRQLLYFIKVGRHLFTAHLSELGIHKLICNSFAILTEGSVRDSEFWAVIKQQANFDQLLFSLLLDEGRQPIRKGISENIAVACSPTKLLKKPGKSETSEQQEAAAYENPARIDILATIWAAFVQNFPQTLDCVQQSQEFFEIAHLVFHSVAEKSPRDLMLSEYLKQWSAIMLNHQTEEFVGREPIDHLILGFCRLLRSCLELASSTNTTVDTFNLTENLFDKYLFPDLSMSSSEEISPQTPVMHTTTRQELYSILSLLCKYDENYPKVVDRLDDIIPEDYTYSSSWCFDRHKMIRSPEGYAGLKNLSNTCYMNSLLTQLFMNVGFRDFMMQLRLVDPGVSQKLLEETKKVFGYMQETWLKSVDPQGLVDSIRTYDNEAVDVTIQMDVDEFYNLLFDRWEAQISDAEDKKKFRSFYGGQLVQQIKSKECPHISERLEPFSAIQCDIKGKASLEESLQAYVEGEIMQGENKYSCTSCGRHVDAVKRACLKDVPDNLIFHLKRFDFDMVTMMRSKINDEFQFPEHIDMSPFKVEYLSDPDTDIQEDIFELVGVLVHSGTAESGHYYSYIRERPTAGTRGSWVEFNDSDVSRFDPSKIADQCFGGYNDSLNNAAMGQVRFNKVWNAYMLFYQRVSSMELSRSIYKPTTSHYPVRVSLPVPLANHIVMENEVFIRTYCLLDPYHTLFVRYLLCQLHDTEHSKHVGQSKLDKSVIFSTLDTLEQLISRTREPLGLDVIVSELLRAINDLPKAAYRVLQWVAERPAAIRNLVLKSPHATVRNSSIRIFVCALSKLQELRNNAEQESIEKDRWRARYLDGFENVIAALDGLWGTLHTVSRSWDDYFEFLLLLASFGTHEAGLVLNYGFLAKCLEIVWLDRDDTKRLRRHYIAYCKLIEKGRRYSHKKLTELLSVLLTNIDFTALPTSDDERQALPDNAYSLTATENDLIRSVGRNNELLVLKKILQQYSSPQACRSIVSLLVDAEPEAGLTDPICKALEDGLRVAPAELCAPFLEATLIFCRRSTDEERIVSLIDYVSRGVDSINDSGGKEHLAFFTNIMACRNERLGLKEEWFISQLTDKIPDWAPTLLLFPDRAVRSTTLEVLRRILFTGETSDFGDDWKSRHTQAAKELVHASISRLRKTYLSTPGINVEAKVVETIRTVVNHCLVTYFDDSEQDQEFVHQAHGMS